MKHLISTYVVLLVSSEVLAITTSNNLFEPRSSTSGALGQLSVRSLDARILSLARRNPYQIQPRIADHSIKLQRRSGQGRGNNQRAGRSSPQPPSPSKVDSLGDQFPRVVVSGQGPVKVTGERDGHKRALPSTPPGLKFDLPAYSSRHTRLTVKATEDAKTGHKGSAKVLAIGNESAKARIETQDALGHIERVSPPPPTQRFVAPYKHDEEEAKAAEGSPRKQVVKAMINGEGTIVADAKNARS